MAIEVSVWDLEVEHKEVFYSVHGFKEIFQGGEDRILHGWYDRKGIRVKFYYKPSWFTRQRMYWLHGWKWIDVDDKET